MNGTLNKQRLRIRALSKTPKYKVVAMYRDLRGLPIFKEAGLTVELGRIQYTGNTAKVYLPYKVREALKLDPQKDNALILVYDDAEGTLILIRNERLLDALKPQILEARKAYQTIKNTLDSATVIKQLEVD